MKTSGLFVGVVGAMIFGAVSVAEAKDQPEKRVPLKPALLAGKRTPIVEAQANLTSIALNRYEQVVTVVRTRSEGKKFATFHAEPALIKPGAMIAFEIRSEGPTGYLVRWRCGA